MRRILLALLLTGCATTDPQIVKVPVQAPCIDPSDTPPKPVLKFEQSPWTDGKTAAQYLLLDYYALQSYATRLEIQLAGCVSK